MSKQFKIIELNIGDWQLYRDLRLHALKNDPQAFGSNYKRELVFDESKWQSRLEKYSEKYKQYNSFVADENNNLVGMIGSFESDNETMTIVGVYVKPESRGNGVSRILMEDILNKIKSNPKYKKVKLTVNKDQITAVKLYEKFGFKEITREYATLGDGVEHEELIMELSI